MTEKEAAKHLLTYSTTMGSGQTTDAQHNEAKRLGIKALEILPKYKDAYGKGWDDGAKATYEHMKMCKEEQEPKTEWIPVSERLPEDRREVSVTAYWHETYQVMMASYFGDGLWWCVPFNNCGEHTQRLKPKAWMPLPKPYEPQERSEDEA